MSSVTMLYEDEDLQVEGELVKGNPFIHCRVENNDLSTMKKVKRVWEDVKEGFYYEGYDVIYAASPNKRFIKFIGGSLHAELEDDKGVYRWELKQR